MSQTSTVKPPLTLPVIEPLMISSFSWAFSSTVQLRARRAFSCERRVSPKPSSTESRATSTVSPILTFISPSSFSNILDRNGAFGFQSCVDDDVVTGDVDDGSVEDGTGLHLGFRDALLEELGKRF